MNLGSMSPFWRDEPSSGEVARAQRVLVWRCIAFRITKGDPDRLGECAARVEVVASTQTGYTGNQTQSAPTLPIYTIGERGFEVM